MIVLAQNEQEMLEILRVEPASLESGLRLNRTKCCLLIVDRPETIPMPLRLIHDIETNDIYLGEKLTNRLNRSPEKNCNGKRSFGKTS